MHNSIFAHGQKILKQNAHALGIVGGVFIVVLVGLLISLFIINGTQEFSRAQVFDPTENVQML